VPDRRVIVVEDDPFTRLIAIVLDPDSSPERRAAFADFMAHDADFPAWIDQVRADAASLYPAEVRLVTSQAEMRSNLSDAEALVVESFSVETIDLVAAHRLKVVQKFGTGLRNINIEACNMVGAKVLTLRRRANIACAEHAFALMLTLARKLPKTIGLVSADRIRDAGIPLKPFDRRHTPGGNYPRIGGLRMLNGTTLGLIGLGEIGREIALRAQAFGMRVIYHQRTRVEPDERQVGASYVPLATLLAESDWIVPQVPTGPGTRDLLNRAELSQIKPGAGLVNVANAAIVNREAVIEALKSGRLAGFALDTFYKEPAPDDDELLRMDNVILTPRMAGSPRTNGLQDFADLITGLARELAA